MKLLVTGNCGFIGQNFVRLYKDEHEIMGIDKLSYASDKKAKKLCKTYILDIAKNSLKKVFKNNKFDAIINFAASSHVDRSIISPETFIYDNYVGTFKLLEMAREYDIKFCHISTDETMGDLQADDSPFSNPHLLKPSSPYSASKAAADLLVMAYHRTYGLNTVITRSCNNYGPHQFEEKFIPVVINSLINGERIPLYGDGKNIREWIYVDDHCHGIMHVLKNGKNGEIYNLGSGTEISNIGLILQISTLLNSPALIKFVEDRKGHDFRYAIDSFLAHSIGWSAKTNLEDGLNKTIEWYGR